MPEYYTFFKLTKNVKGDNILKSKYFMLIMTSLFNVISYNKAWRIVIKPHRVTIETVFLFSLFPIFYSSRRREHNFISITHYIF